MRIGWIGFHQEGIPAFEAVVQSGYDVAGLVTLDGSSAARRSGAADYRPICQAHGIPVHEVKNINDATSIDRLRDLDLDLAFVLGWSQILKPAALSCAKIGMIGAHASLLPRNRGSAPVNWAIINGETTTGNSLIWLANNVDAGHVIDQREFPISAYDTCASIYDQVAQSNRDMVLQWLPKLHDRPGHPQVDLDGPLLPRRRPQDGIIDWNQSNQRVYDFVRALTRPYPGAFSFLQDQQFKVWTAALLPAAVNHQHLPGSIVGPVHSPDENACGQLVACRTGGVVLLEIEDAHGNLIRGRELCEQSWNGRVFRRAA